jgi:hypothetical protein
LSASVLGGTTQWRDHVVRVGVSGAAPWELTLAADLTVQSGAWSGPVLMTLAGPDPTFGPPSLRLSNGRVVSNPVATPFRFVGDTRTDGQFTLPTYYTLNARLGKTWALARSKLLLAVEGFNLTNNDAGVSLLSGGNQVGNVNFRQTTNIQLPRSGQLSVRWSF